MRLNIDGGEIAKLAKDPDLGQSLSSSAEKVLSSARSKAPSWLDADWYVRSGTRDSDGEAYAQAIARGSGTVLAEYGGTNSPAYGYFRSSIR